MALTSKRQGSRSYLKGSCPGCKEKLASCTDCTSVKPGDCKKYNTFISKVIGVMLNSDKSACIHRIEVAGYDRFAMEMAKKNCTQLSANKVCVVILETPYVRSEILQGGFPG